MVQERLNRTPTYEYLASKIKEADVIKTTLDLMDEEKYDYIRDTYFQDADSYFDIELNNVCSVS